MLRIPLATRGLHRFSCSDVEQRFVRAQRSRWKLLRKRHERLTRCGRNFLIADFALLFVLTPFAIAAQLPDAPSAVMARQLTVLEDRDPVSAEPAVQVAAGHIPAFNLRMSDVWKDGDSGSSPNWKLSPLAFEMDSAAPQQSLYSPRRRSGASGYSSSFAGQHPVPGTAPDLYRACPADTCSLAETVMCCGTAPPPFVLYLKSPDAVPLTARDNLHSAVMHVIDPFNLGTIAVDSAIGIASDPHTVYGPGFNGFAKYAGVSLTEDMTGEFFGTFLIPSLMHQDPHYHREPFMPVKHRILHAFAQVVWTKSYTGQPMFNYANIVGGIATAAVSNTFVPGPGRQGFGATAQRLAVAFAISPSGNLIEEFVPDLASRINLRVVIFQRILNTVSKEEGGAGFD